MGCSIIREGLAAFHSETTEKIGRFAKWCIYFIYHLQSGVYAIYTTCASIGKMAPLVYIYIYHHETLETEIRQNDNSPILKTL